MRFHVISLPHTNTTEDFSVCAYTEKVRKFCIMMTDLGHEVFLYAGTLNSAPCTEHIPCLSEDQRADACGGKHYVEASFDYTLPHWVTFNSNAIQAIVQRAQPQDFICVIAGLAHKIIADAFPHLMCVEFGIGYGGTFSKYRVFESYAWMHTLYGIQQPNHDANALDGIWYDAVIPGYLETEKFPFCSREERQDYFLFVGRVVDRKGWKIAEDVCRHLGKKLIIAGPGDGQPTYAERIGPVNPEARGILMSRAQALFVPTCYIEPFGNVNVEAQACGTPVITTDWGAFTETVIQGVTGFRCRTFQEFIDAANNVHKLDPLTIATHAQCNYSLEAVGLKYQTYFERLLDLWGKGWYQLRKEDEHAVETRKVEEGHLGQYQNRDARRKAAKTGNSHRHEQGWPVQGQEGAVK